MGAWGTSLYANDSACDIRDDYLDKLKRGKTNEEATKELIDANGSAGDAEEDALFWFALADTQWNYGRLLQEVKEKALFYLTDGQESTRWEDAGQKQQRAWEKTLATLKQKLESPQPPIKKVSQYRIYRCKWNMGDVFAYQLESKLAKGRGLCGRFFLIRKVDETTWYPGHIVPIVYVKITDDDTLPTSTEEYNGLEYVQTSFTKYEQRFCPIDMSRPQEDIAEKSKINYQIDEYGFLPEYRVILLNTSKKVIPAQLFYIGNFSDANPPQNEFVPHAKENIVSVSWKLFEETFETKMIKRYCGHNLRELSIYNRQQQKEY